MKNLVLLLAVLVSFQSCKDDPSFIPDIYWGEVSALKNGQPWKGLIYAQPNKPYGFFVRIDVFKNQEFHREALTIFKIPYDIQKNTIDTIRFEIDTALTGASYATLVDDGDVLGDGFKVYEGETENYITVTSYNEETGEVGGEFEVTFVFSEPGGNRSDPSAPDTIRFTNGQFHTKVKETP